MHTQSKTHIRRLKNFKESIFPDVKTLTCISKRKVAMVVRQHKDKKSDQTEEIYLPIHPSCAGKREEENMAFQHNSSNKTRRDHLKREKEGKEGKGGYIPFGKNRNDFEEDELEKVNREGEDDAEQDLNKGMLLFIFFVKLSVEKPKATPGEASEGSSDDEGLREHRNHRHGLRP